MTALIVGFMWLGISIAVALLFGEICNRMGVGKVLDE